MTQGETNLVLQYKENQYTLSHGTRKTNISYLTVQVELIYLVSQYKENQSTLSHGTKENQ